MDRAPDLHSSPSTAVSESQPPRTLDAPEAEGRDSAAAPARGPARERQVQTIFSEIAPRYDLLNHVLSMNVDRRWRRDAVDRLAWEAHPGGLFLDACAGTYDLALELAGRSGFRGRIVASDFAWPMLAEGLGKLEGEEEGGGVTSPDPGAGRRTVLPLCADTLRLPVGDALFHGALVAFGVRNLVDLDAGLRELYRVLRPGARLIILEFTLPTNRLIRALYLFYFNRILPVVGRVVSGHPWAYTYLPESVKEFPGPEGLAGKLAAAGFTDIRWKTLTFGIAAIHMGVRGG